MDLYLSLSYIRYASWDVVRGMIDVDLALKELSRAAYFQPYSSLPFYRLVFFIVLSRAKVRA